MENESFYVTGMAIMQFAQGARNLGIHPFPSMSFAGINENDLGPTTRVPEDQYEKFVLHLAKASAEPAFGAAIGQNLFLPLYEPIVTLGMHSENPIDAFKSIAKYFNLATGNSGDLICVERENDIVITGLMVHKNPELRRHVAENVMVLLLSLFRLVTGIADLSFSKVSFEHHPISPTVAHSLTSIFDCEIEWGAPENQIVINKKDCQGSRGKAVSHSIRRSAEEEAKRAMKSLGGQSAFLEKVRWSIRSLMLTGKPGKEAVSHRLHLSPRTLERRLKEENTSWKIIVDDVRKELAVELVTETDMTVSEISAKLGFSSARSLHRCFRSWFGKTVTEYRNSLTKKQ